MIDHLKRRHFLLALSSVTILGLNKAGANDMPAQWNTIIEQTKALERAALKLGFTADWRQYAPPHFSIKPPAEESRILDVEKKIGRPLPSTLRHFFKACSSGIDIYWLLPGKMTDTTGYVDVTFTLVPPKPFSDDKNEPLINSGGFRIDLDEIVELCDARRNWIDSFRQEASKQTDEGGKAHYTVYANMMERGFPITTNGGGDIVAIDMESPGEELFMSFHDGSDEPAWIFGQNLLDHLDQQSRLGFIGFEIYILSLFENEKKNQQAITAFNNTYKDKEAVEEYELAAISAHVLDWASDNGKAWRNWLQLSD